MSLVSHRACLAGIVAAVIWSGGWQSAAWGATADELIRQGVELRRTGNNEGALKVFQQSLALESSPRAFAQVGLAEQALGLWANAEGHLEKALAQPADPWVVKNRATLETALGTVREHIGRVEVLGEPAGATVRINGDAVATLPMPAAAHVSSGTVDVEVTASGYRRAARTLTLGAGQYQKLVIRLEPVQTASPSATAVTTPADGAPIVGPSSDAAGGPGEGAGVGQAPGGESGSGLRPLALGVGAVGVAAAITGTVFYVLAGKKVNQIESDIRTRGQYVEGNENWKTFETTGIILWAVGAVGLAGGAVLWGLDGRERGREHGRQLSLVPGVTNGRLHLAAGWKF